MKHKLARRELGLFLRNKRKRRELTQVDLAAKLGISSQFVANWERGASSPPLPIIPKLRRVLSVPRKELINILTRMSSAYWQREIR